MTATISMSALTPFSITKKKKKKDRRNQNREQRFKGSIPVTGVNIAKFGELNSKKKKSKD